MCLARRQGDNPRGPLILPPRPLDPSNPSRDRTEEAGEDIQTALSTPAGRLFKVSQRRVYPTEVNAETLPPPPSTLPLPKDTGMLLEGSRQPITETAPRENYVTVEDSD